MKYRKIKILIAAFFGIIAIAGIALSMAFTEKDTTTDSTETELLNVIEQADQIENDSVVLPIDMLKENLKTGDSTILTEEQAQQLINEKETENNYLSEKIKVNMLSNMQGNLSYYTQYSFGNIPELSLPVRKGALDYIIINTTIDGKTATVEFTKVGWLISVERNDEDSSDYYIWMIFCKDTNTDCLVQTDGSWVLDTEDMTKEFAPDDYNYDKGHYATIEDALDAAEKLDPAAENPFK